MLSWLFGIKNNDSTNEELVKKIVLELENKKIEREIALKEAFEERERAYNLAKERESIFWTVPSGIAISIISIISSYHHKNIMHLLPVGPVLGYLGYQTHSAFGNKREYILKNASLLLLNDEVCGMKLNPITVEEVNEKIHQNKYL